MSGIIKLLPNHIANQIAAGEVIQRPASVVKELVENAIDAKSTKIAIIIKDAGKTLIQIIDDGIGMTEEDAVLCFERHATSKITKTEDIFTINTKGFRGEALASIASVSQVSLKTKKNEMDTGILIINEACKISKKEPVVVSNGTSIEVKNLFFNIPARRSFLKSDNIEFGHIKEEVIRIALAHPEIGFTLKHNDIEVYNLFPSNLRKRIVSIFGAKSDEKLIPIEVNSDIVSITGFVGKPDFAKKTRGEQYFFVNDRFFKDNYFHNAISKAFDNLLAAKHFPSYFLYLKINPSKIDVNVHPTKTEIKFEEEKFIYPIILSAVKESLGFYNIMPSLDFDRETSFDLPYHMKENEPVPPQIKIDVNYNPFNSSSFPKDNNTKKSHSQAISNFHKNDTQVNQADWESFYEIKEEDIDNQINIDIDVNNQFNNILLHDKYLIVSSNQDLIIVDVPKMSERICYDQLMNEFISQPIVSQKMLFPHEREMSTQDISAWNENESILKRFGFEWHFEKKQLMIEAIPSILQNENIDTCVDLILENIAYKAIEKGEIAHEVIAALAYASSKNKKVNTQEEAKNLLHLFFNGKEMLTAKGKKIYSTITQTELKSKF